MLTELFSYDPNTISPENRVQMAGILQARGEYLRASAEISDLRARAWSGEEGLGDISDLKAVYLTELRKNYTKQVGVFLKSAVDLEGLKELVPTVLAGVLQNFKTPLPVVMEAVGMDLDNFKIAAEQLKRLMEEL